MWYHILFINYVINKKYRFKIKNYFKNYLIILIEGFLIFLKLSKYTLKYILVPFHNTSHVTNHSLQLLIFLHLKLEKPIMFLAIKKQK